MINNSVKFNDLENKNKFYHLENQYLTTWKIIKNFKYSSAIQ